MENKDLALALGTYILANTAMLWQFGKMLITRLVEYRLMQIKIEQLEKDLKDFKDAQGKTNDKIFGDIKGVSIKVDSRK